VKVGDLVRHTEFEKLMGVVVEVEFNSEASFQSLVTVCCAGYDPSNLQHRVCFYQYDWEVLNESG
jgi:hypothetical protein